MTLVEDLLLGIVVGSAYSLVAVTITLMFRSTGVLSFAHAAFAMVGAYVYADLAVDRDWPPALAAPVALGVVVAYGLVVERVAIRPVRESSVATKLIVTLGVLALSSGLMLVRYGATPKVAPFLLPNRSVDMASLAVPYQRFAILGLAGVTAVALGWFLRKTKFGIGVRAVAEDGQAAQLMGVSLHAVARFNWALGASLAGLTGILVAPLSVTTVATFPLLLMKALTACLFGGLVSLPLAFVGGLVVGVVESEVTLRTSTDGARELAILVVVLALLLGRRSWTRVGPEGLAQVAPAGGALWRRVSEGRIGSPVIALLDRLQGAMGAAVLATLVAGATLALVIPMGSEYWAVVACRSLFYVIEGLSLVLLVGWGGQVSLMQGAYVGIGAFMTSALFVTHGLPLEITIPAAALAGTAMGALAGLPSLRLSGLQFAIASLAFGAAASEWLFHREGLARTIPRGTLFGIDLFDTGNLYVVMLVVTVLAYLATWQVRRSTFGAILLASRDAPGMVAHFGARPGRVRMATFLLASFIAALGGSLFGILIGAFNPLFFSIQLSIALLLYTVIGGISSLGGPLIAGLLFGLVPQLLQRQAGTESTAWPEVIAGVTVVVLVAIRPRGLASLFTGSRRRDSAATGAAPVRLGRFEPVVDSRLAPVGNGRTREVAR